MDKSAISTDPWLNQGTSYNGKKKDFIYIEMTVTLTFDVPKWSSSGLSLSKHPAWEILNILFGQEVMAVGQFDQSMVAWVGHSGNH